MDWNIKTKKKKKRVTFTRDYIPSLFCPRFKALLIAERANERNCEDYKEVFKNRSAVVDDSPITEFDKFCLLKVKLKLCLSNTLREKNKMVCNVQHTASFFNTYPAIFGCWLILRRVLSKINLHRVHQPFFWTFFVLFSRFFLEASECNSASDWLKCMV